jgi:ribosomal protein S18 acetylase RimI-like enzyme
MDPTSHCHRQPISQQRSLLSSSSPSAWSIPSIIAIAMNSKQRLLLLLHCFIGQHVLLAAAFAPVHSRLHLSEVVGTKRQSKKSLDAFFVAPSAHVRVETKSSRRIYRHHVVLKEGLQQQQEQSCSSYELYENADSAVIDAAAEFLVEHFWLQTPRHWTDPTATNVIVPNRSALVREQADDLMSKYGERLGSSSRRLLKAGLIWIRDTTTTTTEKEGGPPLGLVALAEVLMNVDDGSIMTPEASVERLQNAVASLGPKQRRAFLKATAKEICDELLAEEERLTIVCLVSNLSVASTARRRGTGLQLCRAAEQVAQLWSHDQLYLKVETDNEAALALYQTKLQYRTEFAISTDAGVRLDKTVGAYTIQEAIPTLLMSKRLL